MNTTISRVFTVLALSSLLLCLNHTTTFAAELRSIKQMSDFRLDDIRISFDQIKRRHSTDQLYGYLVGVVIVSVNPNEPIENTVKQIIYRHFTGPTKPEKVHVEPLRMDENGIRRAVHDSLSNLDIRSPVVANRYEKLVENRILGTKDFRLYIGSEGNTFGGGKFAAYVDKRHKEILVTGSRYSE